MKKMFFLTAIFQNKYGKAKKYYDEKGWHWMLASDKPNLYSDKESASKEADHLGMDVLSEITINEILVYENLWEHKIEGGKFISPSDIIHERIENKFYIFLSYTKQLENAKLITGLYRINRETDTWIYGVEKKAPSTVPLTDLKPEVLIAQCVQKLNEAKALMLIFDYDRSEITKTEGVIALITRLVKNQTELSSDDSDIPSTPEEMIKGAYEKLEEAKTLMLFLGYEKTDISKLDGVMIFVKKLIK